MGSAQLLMSQKFQQFRGLCEQNLVSVTLIPSYSLCNLHSMEKVLLPHGTGKMVAVHANA